MLQLLEQGTSKRTNAAAPVYASSVAKHVTLCRQKRTKMLNLQRTAQFHVGVRCCIAQLGRSVRTSAECKKQEAMTAGWNSRSLRRHGEVQPQNIIL
uniref:Uncharacterized protein n=1 Tax=Trichuris muris TaxID=70415 RepID=A0A5S6QH78_TRIMR